MTTTTGVPAGLARHAGRWYGKYAGMVTKVDLDQKLGWIEVEVPSVFPDGPAVVARPCFPPGHFWVPPVGTRVWVEFEAGDPSSPLWVGTWYAQGEVPAEADRNPPTSRVLHTPSGHVVEISDEDGKERVILRSKQNGFVALDEDGSVVCSSKTGALLFLNAKDDEASLVSPQGHSVSLTSGSISLVHASQATVEVRDGTVSIAASKVEVIGDNVAVAGGGVSLGSAPVQFGVLVANPAVVAFGMHVHPTGVGPSGPPTPPLLPVAASMNVKAQM